MIRIAFLFLVSFASVAAAEELPVPPIPPAQAPTTEFAPMANWMLQDPRTSDLAAIGFGTTLREARPYEVASSARGQTAYHKTVQPIAAGLRVTVSF